MPEVLALPLTRLTPPAPANCPKYKPINTRLADSSNFASYQQQSMHKRANLVVHEIMTQAIPLSKELSKVLHEYQERVSIRGLKVLKITLLPNDQLHIRNTGAERESWDANCRCRRYLTFYNKHLRLASPL